MAFAQSCGCCKLRHGAKICAIYTAIASLLYVGLLFIRNLGHDMISRSVVREVMTYFSAVLFIAEFAASLQLLFLAAPKKRPGQLKPWMVITLVFIIYPTMMIIWMFQENEENGWEHHYLEFMLAAFHSVNSIVCLICEYFVLSFFVKLIQRKGVDNIINDKKILKRRAMDALHKVQVDMGRAPAAPSVADYATTYGGSTYMSPPMSVLSASTAPWFTTGTVAPSTYAAAPSIRPAVPAAVNPSVYASVHGANRLH